MFEKTMLRGLVAVALLLSLSAAARGQVINLVPNGSFENPVIPLNGRPFEYGPPSTDWYYSGAGISNNTAAWGFQTTGAIPDGNQFCFLQGNGTYVSEQVTFPAPGTYLLTYYAGGRFDNGDQPPVNRDNYGGNTTYDIALNSAVLANGTTTTNSTMTQRGPVYFSALAGTETLKLQVTGVSGVSTNQTALFDAVSITPATQAKVLTYTTPGIASVTLPACTATIQCWSAGGNGSAGSITGGGGGGYASATFTLPAGTYHFQVGAGGSGPGTCDGYGNGTVGNADTVWDWNGTSGGKELWGIGGNNVESYLGHGGHGFDAAYLSTTDVNFAGGFGGNGHSSSTSGGGGGGGGCAGPSGFCGDANSGGVLWGGAGSFGNGGGNGGMGGYDGLIYEGENGVAPGGGGGGGAWINGTGYAGGTGANGEILLTYSAEAVPPTFQWNATTGLWGTSTNWNPSSVPGVGDIVVFGPTVSSGTAVIALNGAAPARLSRKGFYEK